MISSQPLFADSLPPIAARTLVGGGGVAVLAKARCREIITRRSTTYLAQAAETAARPGWFAATGRQLSTQNVRASYEVLSTVKTRTTSEC
jgi:hypothetical protein